MENYQITFNNIDFKVMDSKQLVLIIIRKINKKNNMKNNNKNNKNKKKHLL